MGLKDFYERLSFDKSLEKKLNFNPYYCSIESGLNDPIVINGKKYINLASNNYLGLAADERVKRAAIKAVEKYGTSMCGTPIATGYAEIFKQLEERLARFIGLEAAIIFPSGYQANCALIPAIATREDLLIVDHYAHASLIHGIKAGEYKVKPFLHNNMEHLQKILEKTAGYKNVFVITESVFSTEGSIAPFDEIVALCKRYNAVPIIDDSHGIGVIGKNGKGILGKKGIKDFQGIYTASLGKALANSGGIVSGRKQLIEFLRYFCSGFTYSTALSPSVLGGVNEVLNIIDDGFCDISKRMWRYKRLISKCLEDCGYKIIHGEAPITSIICGGMEDTIIMSKTLFEHNILSTPFIPPSVPLNQGRVRLIAGANLKEDTIKKCLDIFKNISLL